uniref:Uncharacterized protein n=2 Tax=Picea TaxID=3328 RepID=A0A117NGT2_PICGL|nr:hypothetical protein ABT39_MTgene5471 [Picea glauca]QHR91531.1 hypothetical protein Q903MT_gene5566 [Picea sitchensis]
MKKVLQLRQPDEWSDHVSLPLWLLAFDSSPSHDQMPYSNDIVQWKSPE